MFGNSVAEMDCFTAGQDFVAKFVGWWALRQSMGHRQRDAGVCLGVSMFCAFGEYGFSFDARDCISLGMRLSSIEDPS